MESLNTAIQAMVDDVAKQEEDLIWQALRENGCKTTHPETLARRMEIQVDVTNKNKRVLLDGKIILVISTNHQFSYEDGNLKAIIKYKIIK